MLHRKKRTNARDDHVTKLASGNHCRANIAERDTRSLRSTSLEPPPLASTRLRQLMALRGGAVMCRTARTRAFSLTHLSRRRLLSQHFCYHLTRLRSGEAHRLAMTAHWMDDKERDARDALTGPSFRLGVNLLLVLL